MRGNVELELLTLFGEMERLQVRLGVQPLIFTAPHAIYLHRDDQPDHKPEDHTGYLAEVLAEETGASCITWSSKEVSRSARTSAPNPSNRDPNYLRCDELERSRRCGCARCARRVHLGP